MTRSRSLTRRLAAPLAVLALLALGGCSIFNKDKPVTPTNGNRVPILSRISNEVTADPALATVAVVLPTAQSNAEWSQAGGNAAKSYGHLALAQTPIRAWTVSVAGSTPQRRLAAAPVIGGGAMFVADTNGTVHAFDATSGAKRWSHAIELTGDYKNSAFGGGVSYSDGKVYATNGAGDVLALDATTGKEVWRVRPAGPLRGAPTVAFNQLFVMTQDNQIFALDMADGKVVWNDTASQGEAGVFGVGAPAAGQGSVIAGYSTGELAAYRYENGRNLWSDALARTSISTQVGTLTDVDADPIIDSGRVYALGQGGRMAAYELVTGQRVWELNLAGISTPAVAGEWIFTLTDDARLLAIARSTGRVRWITQLRAWRDQEDKKGPIFWTGPVLAGNRLWVASSRGQVMSVDVATGAASPFAEVDSPVSLGLVVANQTLYILDDGGKISAWR